MNEKTQEALKMAIEALEWAVSNAKIIRDFPKDDVAKYANKTIGVCEDKIQACKEALATEQVREEDSRVRQNDVQPAQEPVAWMNPSNGAVISDRYKKQIGLDGKVNGYKNFSVPLTDHFAPSWQGLTAKEIASIPLNEYTVQTVERMLKEKNT